MIYDRGDIVILPFPFITTDGVQQKARPALIISDHIIERRFEDVILAGITSQRIYDIKQT
ncbi:MAG: type II toxin-antitoxin system PemK/MazF family toxin [Candidatus Methanoperedens sp.]|nr:type II toxin-antitoxin system PemK/MazF family toxin [Candidatus Methanoperedens sp.]